MKSVLVTGGNGFIGRYVVGQLLDKGYAVDVFDTRWREPMDGARLVLGDTRDATSVNEAINHVDGVIHLAGVLGTQETIRNPKPAAETNILGGINVLESCATNDIPLVYIAVGNWWMNNTYSITKNTIERFVDMYVRFRGSRMSVVRALNAYGPRQSVSAPYGSSKVRKIIPSFACRALSGEPIEIYGDGTQIMDMIYVGDVARILVTALEYTADHGAVHSVLEAGTGRATSVNDIAALVASSVATHAGIDVDITHLPMRPGEDERSVVLGNPETLGAIGIKPTELAPIETVMPETVAYFSNYLATR